MVGALLVTAAAVGTFAAYLDATARPTGRYVVATAAIEPGTRLGSLADVGERFGTIALELPSEVAARAIAASTVDGLVGQVVLTPLEPGDLLTRTQLLEDGGVDGAHTLSFALPSTAAVGGRLRPGERIDVLATYGAGDRASTAYVVRGIALLRVSNADGGGSLGDSGEVTLTVAVPAPEDVQALGHAVNTAEVFVARSTADRAGVDAASGEAAGGDAMRGDAAGGDTAIGDAAGGDAAIGDAAGGDATRDEAAGGDADPGAAEDDEVPETGRPASARVGSGEVPPGAPQRTEPGEGG